jgi:hypothetical protein
MSFVGHCFSSAEDVSVIEIVDGGEEAVCGHTLTGSCMGSMSIVCTCSVCGLSDATKKNDDNEDCTDDFFFLTGGWSSLTMVLLVDDCESDILIDLDD